MGFKEDFFFFFPPAVGSIYVWVRIKTFYRFLGLLLCNVLAIDWCACALCNYPKNDRTVEDTTQVQTGLHKLSTLQQ